MPNIKSARKAVRSSKRKNAHNLFWKKKVRDSLKDLKKGIESKDSLEVLNQRLKTFQKLIDKAAKEKVIHKNKANRLKSTYAGKITALSKPASKSKSGSKSAKPTK